MVLYEARLILCSVYQYNVYAALCTLMYISRWNDIECNNYFEKYLTYGKYYYSRTNLFLCFCIANAQSVLETAQSIFFILNLCSPVCQCPRLFLKDNINNSRYNILRKIYFILKWETDFFFKYFSK